MKPLSQELIEREARRAAFARLETSHYKNAMNRYLSTQGYAVGPGGSHPHQAAPAAGTAEWNPQHIAMTVVVGVDGSPSSYVAVDHAAIEAELRGWQIRLVHVRHPTLIRRKLFERRERGAALLAEMAERIRSRIPTLPVTTTLRVGQPSEILVDESAGAGLTVLGNRRYSTVTGLLTPSLSLYLASHAAGPVLVVRVPTWPPGHGWSERPVLVGVDGSAGSTAALEFALAEARLRGCQLLAVHATRVPALSGRVRDPFTEGLLADDTEWISGVRVRRRTVDEDPTEALAAASAHASAVVVGTRGYGEPGRMLPGAVGRSLVHRSHCPVFIVPIRPAAG